tara:strand:+ start:2808 stop:2984 length:177 start_codon:yes stop_codon:yes gene_type:complete
MNKEIKNGWIPDPKWHAYISFLKSTVRLVGYGFIPFNLVTAAVLLASAELLGIIEEMV